MRRARFKVAPNLGSVSRASKPAETSENVTLDESLNSSLLPIANPPNNEESISVVGVENVLPNVVDNPPTPNLNLSPLPPPLPPPDTPALVTPSPTQLSTNSLSSTDKENVISIIQDEAPSENQVSTTIEEQSHSGLSLSRHKGKSKVRPVIRDAPHRIRTFSSASESEDDAGKRQSRTPLSPVKKSPTKKDNIEPSPSIVTTDVVRKGKKKASEKTPLELKKAAMRKKFANGQVDRSQLTMFDLIYYNPIDGDRPPEPKEKPQMRLKPYEVEALALENQTKPVETTGNTVLDDLLNEEEEIRRIEENPDENPDENPEKIPEDTVEEHLEDKTEKEKKEEEENDDDDDDEEEAMPVPQVRLGPNGEIIIDDQSLVIDTSETKRNKTKLANAPVVIENSATLVNYGSWRKRQRSARWSLKETARFYRALSMLGTNFSLMEKLFSNRPRLELKRKFKHEEKINGQLVDKIISTQVAFDPSQFEIEDDTESSEGESTKKAKTKKSSATPKIAKVDVVEEVKDVKKRGRKKKNTFNDDDSLILNLEDDPDDNIPIKKATKRRKKDKDETDTAAEDSAKKTRKKRVSKGKALKNSALPDLNSSGTSRGKKSRKPITPSLVDEDSSTNDEISSITQTEPNDSIAQNVPSDESNPPTESSPTPLDSLLRSPLGQMSLEQGGLTVVEDPRAPSLVSSFLVPPALAEANPAFAQAEPGSLVLVADEDPDKQMVHVYRISAPLEQVPT